MRNISKISSAAWLPVLLIILIGTVTGQPQQKSDSFTDHGVISAPAGDDILYAEPFPALLLSEIVSDNDSEIEPEELRFIAGSTGFDRSFEVITYLKKSKRLLISLKIRDLIFPFHTYL